MQLDRARSGCFIIVGDNVPYVALANAGIRYLPGRHVPGVRWVQLGGGPAFVLPGTVRLPDEFGRAVAWTTHATLPRHHEAGEIWVITGHERRVGASRMTAPRGDGATHYERGSK